MFLHKMEFFSARQCHHPILVNKAKIKYKRKKNEKEDTRSGESLPSPHGVVQPPQHCEVEPEER